MSYDRKRLNETVASEIGNANYSPRRLSLIHSGVFLLGALLVLGILYILQEKITTTGGLSGIGLRSVLTTAQTVLLLIFVILVPFWRFGIYYGAIEVIRGRTASPSDLTAGFYRFGPILRLKLLQMLACGILVVPCASVGVSLLSATPWYAEFEAAWIPILEQAAQGQMIEPDAATMEVLLQVSRPVFLIFFMVYIPAIVYLSYRVRMAKYLIMDDSEACGSFGALLNSWRMTRKRLSTLIRLDVSFLWFGTLKALALALAGIGPALVLLEIPMPISGAAACFISQGVSVLVLMGLSWLFGARRRLTYAIAYDSFRLPPKDKCS